MPARKAAKRWINEPLRRAYRPWAVESIGNTRLLASRRERAKGVAQSWREAGRRHKIVLAAGKQIHSRTRHGILFYGFATLKEWFTVTSAAVTISGRGRRAGRRTARPQRACRTRARAPTAHVPDPGDRPDGPPPRPKHVPKQATAQPAPPHVQTRANSVRTRSNIARTTPQHCPNSTRTLPKIVQTRPC